MVSVNLWSGLGAFSDGKDVVEVDAKNVGEVLSGLVAAHPGLEHAIEAGVSVAVDGKVIARGLTNEVKPDSEIYLLQQLKGG